MSDVRKTPGGFWVGDRGVDDLFLPISQVVALVVACDLYERHLIRAKVSRATNEERGEVSAHAALSLEAKGLVIVQVGEPPKRCRRVIPTLQGHWVATKIQRAGMERLWRDDEDEDTDEVQFAAANTLGRTAPSLGSFQKDLSNLIPVALFRATEPRVISFEQTTTGLRITIEVPGEMARARPPVLDQVPGTVELYSIPLGGRFFHTDANLPFTNRRGTVVGDAEDSHVGTTTVEFHQEYAGRLIFPSALRVHRLLVDDAPKTDVPTPAPEDIPKVGELKQGERFRLLSNGREGLVRTTQGATDRVHVVWADNPKADGRYEWLRPERRVVRLPVPVPVPAPVPNPKPMSHSGPDGPGRSQVRGKGDRPRARKGPKSRR